MQRKKTAPEGAVEGRVSVGSYFFSICFIL
jgi:hypothetical protein